MSLSDIVGRLGLASFPVAALVLFLVVFVAVTARLLSRRRTAEFTHLASLPLEDDETPVQPRASRRNPRSPA